MFDELNPETHQYEQVEAPKQEKAQEAPQESQKEKSHRILRERMEAAERRNAELERMVQMNMSQNQQSTKMQVVEDEDDDLGINDDAYVEARQFKKALSKQKKELKETKKQIEEYRAVNAAAQAEIRLKSQFTDFDSIVSKENLDKLASQKPVLYRSIMASQDIYDRGYTAYEMIKAAGIIDDTYADTDRKIEENKMRPRSAANASPQAGETPLARVGDYDRRTLTEARKEELRRQVYEAKKNKR